MTKIGPGNCQFNPKSCDAFGSKFKQKIPEFQSQLFYLVKCYELYIQNKYIKCNTQVQKEYKQNPCFYIFFFS